MMIALLALALAAQTAEPAPGLSSEPTAGDAYRDCIRMTSAEPAKAERLSKQWILQEGGVPARHCQAMAELALGKTEMAVATLEGAARLTESAGGRETADLYGQAGNAALIAGKPEQAKDLFDRALISLGRGRDALRADLLIDRARAETDLSQLDAARADLLSATQVAPDNADAWLLLATAERRADNLGGAENAIREAIRLMPEDPEVLAEAARIAATD
ncbi:MAG: tetratricopeptide repeat protein [Pacificimonas sp.]